MEEYQRPSEIEYDNAALERYMIMMNGKLGDIKLKLNSLENLYKTLSLKLDGNKKRKNGQDDGLKAKKPKWVKLTNENVMSADEKKRDSDGFIAKQPKLLIPTIQDVFSDVLVDETVSC